ncbi:MAG: methionine--tRNA ligase [Proteobacteria bacterium]|nr:methionine--tRNA ligase [Pseudomonadota bacterium]
MTNHYYITTAIDYPNGRPHIGHAYEKTLADLYARWHKLLGKKTFFLTGTDENGQKLELSAQTHNYPNTQSYVDHHSEYFRQCAQTFAPSHTDFIRTTEDRHLNTVKTWWRHLSSKGDIYQGEYAGLYCYHCEQFIPQNKIKEGNLCPIHEKPLTALKEKGYFFKLSKYQDTIKDLLTHHPEFVFPSSAYEEMLSRIVSEPLMDLPVSRKSKGWGIPVPDDSAFVIYTWFDALINYYSVISCGDLPQDAWPPDGHIIGKDITWFHAVIWPAMLTALELQLPKKIIVHGMVLDGQGKKMSKTAGNIISPTQLTAHFPLDSIRYVFLRYISHGSDGKISLETIQTKHNQELANDLGNLVSRLIKLSLKKLGTHITAISSSPKVASLSADASKLIEKVCKDMETYHHHKAMDHLFEEVSALNAYLNQEKPWGLDNTQSIHNIIYPCLFRLNILTWLLSPFMPSIAERILSYLGIKDLSIFSPWIQPPHSHNTFAPNFQLTSPEPLFVKIETLS